MSNPGGRKSTELSLQMMEGLPPARRAARPRGPRFAEQPAALAAFAALAEAYARLRQAPQFFAGVDQELTRFAGRPTALVHARRFSAANGGARIYLKLEDRIPRDAHLRIVADGEALVASALRRKRMIAGVRKLRLGEHMAAACARFGLGAELYADRAAVQRQPADVARLRVLGATVHSVDPGEHGGDVRNAALQAWLRRPQEDFLFMGLEAGPQPYPHMLRDVTGVVGRECRRQVQALAGRLPDVVVARGGDNAEALTLFPAFVADSATRLVCVEPPPESRPDKLYDAVAVTATQQLRLNAVLEGSEYGTLARERAAQKATGRIEYFSTSLGDARRALTALAHSEGIVLGTESAHAVAWAAATAKGLPAEAAMVVLIAERPAQDLAAG